MTHRLCLPARTCRPGLLGLLGLLIPALGLATDSFEASSTEKAILPSPPVHSDSPASNRSWHLQTSIAFASESDFGPALAFYYERPDQLTHVSSVSIGRQVGDSLFGWPADIMAYGGIQHYGEQGFQPDAMGATVYIKAYRQYTLGKRQFPLRLGLGEGLSYVSRIPVVEVEDFLPDTSAKLTNYLEWTLQTSLNHLLGRNGRRFSPGIKDVYIGYTVFHRSTVFGLFASKGGGVNYMGIGVELVLD